MIRYVEKGLLNTAQDEYDLKKEKKQEKE